MWFPKKYYYNMIKFTIMKVDLKVSAASKILTMAGCPKICESQCGIMYRGS